MEEMLKQAKLKALHLLTDMDRTEEQLRLKLKQKKEIQALLNGI